MTELLAVPEPEAVLVGSVVVGSVVAVGSVVVGRGSCVAMTAGCAIRLPTPIVAPRPLRP